MSGIRIGHVGLGRMGGNMAARLLESGYEVVGFDVSDAALERFEDAGGEPRATAAEVASDADVVITSLPDPPIVKDAYTGEAGILDGDVAGTTAIEMSTIDPDTTLEIADAAADRELELVGAPVSGGPDHCANGTLMIMAGGNEAVIESDPVRTVFDELSKDVHYLGAIDSGHTVKLLNNVMALGNLLVGMEAVSIGVERGIEGERLMNVLTNTGASSALFNKLIPQVLNRDFEAGFPIDLGTKDLGLALDTADEMNRPMFAGSLIHDIYTGASAQGYGHEDVSAVVKFYEQFQEETVEADSEVEATFDY